VDNPATPLVDESTYIALMGIDQGVTLGDGTTINAARRVHIAYLANAGQFRLSEQ